VFRIVVVLFVSYLWWCQIWITIFVSVSGWVSSGSDFDSLDFSFQPLVGVRSHWPQVLPPVFARPLWFSCVVRSLQLARSFPVPSPKARLDFRLLFFCAVSHWSAACSGLDFVATAALLVSARRYLFWPVWSIPPRMFDTQGVIRDSAARLILFCHQWFSCARSVSGCAPGLPVFAKSRQQYSGDVLTAGFCFKLSQAGSF
jgi:hypothetical protein